MKYYIKLSYESLFWKTQTEEIINEIFWNNLDKAIENIKAIKEHYLFLLNFDSISYSEKIKIKSNFNPKWFNDENEERIFLFDDNDNRIEYLPPWIYSVEDFKLQCLDIIEINSIYKLGI